jgi:predicted MPP superfamily phosphohydrolase
MRKPISFLIAAVVLVGIFFVLKSALPKYAGFLPFIMILILLDVYLWYSVKNKFSSKKPVIKYLVLGLYFLPLMLLVSSILTGVAIPFKEWNIAYRTYLMGIVTIVYVSKFIVIDFLFISDVIRVLQFGFQSLVGKSGKKFNEIRRIRSLVFIGWISGTGFFLLLISGMIFWNFYFNVKQETIRLPELPSSFDGTRIIQVSDIHLGSWACPEKLRNAVELINSQNPDIVFFTGDLVNYTSYESYEFANILKEIKAPLGIFAIMGNHDYGDYIAWPSPEAKLKNLDYLHEIYKYMGWKLLLNEHVIIHRGSDSIAVIGVENWGGSKRFPRLGDLDKATKGIENTGVQLLLSHDPSHWDKIVKHNFRNIDITFSGHTHGFQFGLECCGIRWSPSQYMYKEWAGLYAEPVAGSHPQYLYVSRGLGSIGYPGRIGILPEITLFVLRK